MPLPEPGPRVPWPPVEIVPSLIAMQEWDAWYSGSPARLADFYDRYASRLSERPGAPAIEWWRFYSRNQSDGGQRTRAAVHVPIAGDIAQTSAAMLFGEEPVIQIPEAHDDDYAARAVAQETEARLLAIVEEGGVIARLAEAAEQASAIGGVYLKVAWDVEFAPHPFLVVEQADAAIPEWRFGRLAGVTFWRVIERSGREVLRHVERYEPGVILHGLYRGTIGDSTQAGTLGSRVPLAAHPLTAALPEVVTLPDPKMLAARYVPNMLPNRRMRGSDLGQSDMSGVESLLDAADETMTSWMRDVRLAKARITVPEDYLAVSVSADGSMRSRFDVDREVYAPLSIEPGQDKTTITATQFAIRAEEFEKTLIALIERIVTSAGYSPQTFGINIEGRADSGTALRLRERKTQITRERKAMLWQSPLSDVLAAMLRIDAAVFGTPGIDPSLRPRVEIRDGLPDDFGATASAVELVRRAGAMSVETSVRMLHPEWDTDEVAAEVARIRDDQRATLPDPTMLGLPGIGDAEGDEGEPGAEA